MFPLVPFLANLPGFNDQESLMAYKCVKTLAQYLIRLGIC